MPRNDVVNLMSDRLEIRRSRRNRIIRYRQPRFTTGSTASHIYQIRAVRNQNRQVQDI